MATFNTQTVSDYAVPIKVIGYGRPVIADIYSTEKYIRSNGKFFLFELVLDLWLFDKEYYEDEFIENHKKHPLLYTTVVPLQSYNNKGMKEIGSRKELTDSLVKSLRDSTIILDREKFLHLQSLYDVYLDAKKNNRD